MRRRDFLMLIGGATLVPSLTSRAQGDRPRKRIGVLIPYPAGDKLSETHLALFRDALEQHGWKDGSNLQIDYRWADAGSGNLQIAAKELVALGPDAILVRSTPAAAALHRNTRKIPIVFVVVSDPVGDGLIESVARPGGNLTGFTNVEASLGGKWLELLKEIAPTTTRVAAIYGKRTSPGGGSYYMHLIESAASAFELTTTEFPIDHLGDVEKVLQEFSREPHGALLVPPDATTTGHHAEIIALAARFRLPAIYAFRDFVAEGGLISYGVEVGDLYRRAATYLDRIFRGESPSDLPVQAPTKFELVVNTKAAKEIGLNIPATLLARADEVIE